MTDGRPDNDSVPLCVDQCVCIHFYILNVYVCHVCVQLLCMWSFRQLRGNPHQLPYTSHTLHSRNRYAQSKQPNQMACWPHPTSHCLTRPQAFWHSPPLGFIFLSLQPCALDYLVILFCVLFPLFCPMSSSIPSVAFILNEG